MSDTEGGMLAVKFKRNNDILKLSTKLFKLNFIVQYIYRASGILHLNDIFKNNFTFTSNKLKLIKFHFKMTKNISLLFFTIFLSCSTVKNDSDSKTETKNLQSTKLKNPSFEDSPEAAHTPKYWTNCGSPSESPPDIHPNNTFNVSNKPNHGDTYLGLVVRDVETYESISQKLSNPLLRDSSYVFSAYLSRSTVYQSMSQLTKKNTYYNTPCILRIWAGNSECENGELLVATQPINHSSWKKYDFKLTPKKQWKFIKFEAYYEGVKTYNGNLLMDNLSEIQLSPSLK